MKKSRLMRGLSLNILALGFTSMLTDVSSEMVFTLLPFFMVNVLGLDLVGIKPKNNRKNNRLRKCNLSSITLKNPRNPKNPKKPKGLNSIFFILL
ncbi:MAG: hypothetical protein NWF08_00420 [Candidatus Bathyarchaeota archaeon]|nr:hypothetical protein [Candidatus Bathyarchaeota archaeon]